MQIRWSDYFVADLAAGTLTWKDRPSEHFGSVRGRRISNTKRAGKIAGRLNGCYLRIEIDRKRYYAHRIIWEMANGPIPPGMQIDHIDGIKANNTITNLRIATPSQNNMNSGMRNNNVSGVKGVCFNKASGKWIAQIGVNGQTKYLGIFTDIEDARAAYIDASTTHHGEFARTG